LENKGNIMKNVTENQRKKWQCFTVLLLLVCLGRVVVDAQTPEQVAQNGLRSTVILKMQPTATNNSQGSGFFVGDGVIVTNYHVIEGATKGTVKLVGTEQASDIEGYIAIDKDHDLAVLKVANLYAPPLPLGDSDIVQIGEVVYAVGNPRGLEGTFSDGIISNIQPNGNSGIRGEVIQMTAPISQGSSGGAVLNSNGEVIGIAASIRKDGQNLNFAIPVNYLKALLDRAGPVQPLVAAPSTPGKNALSNILNLIILSITVLV
jgi:S1-C subfamily serine protease